MLRGDDFYIKAFWELCSERSFGQGAIGPIPHSRIEGYGDRRGLVNPMLEVFCGVVRELDEEYLSYQQEEQKKRMARNKPKAPKTPNSKATL